MWKLPPRTQINSNHRLTVESCKQIALNHFLHSVRAVFAVCIVPTRLRASTAHLIGHKKRTRPFLNFTFSYTWVSCVSVPSFSWECCPSGVHRSKNLGLNIFWNATRNCLDIVQYRIKLIAELVRARMSMRSPKSWKKIKSPVNVSWATKSEWWGSLPLVYTRLTHRSCGMELKC